MCEGGGLVCVCICVKGVGLCVCVCVVVCVCGGGVCVCVNLCDYVTTLWYRSYPCLHIQSRIPPHLGITYAACLLVNPAVYMSAFILVNWCSVNSEATLPCVLT